VKKKYFFKAHKRTLIFRNQQGCTVFLFTANQNGEKYTKIATKNTNWPQHMYTNIVLKLNFTSKFFQKQTKLDILVC
jgi:hypothetical protein